MKTIDLSNVQEAGEFRRPDPGAYVCTITDAEDVPEKEYLRISYDIAEGDFSGYYAEMRANNPDWNVGVYYRSYKPKALGMLKRFCSAISKSNGAFIFDAGAVNSDEKTLIGKKVGLVLQEEEYYGNDGNKKTRLIVNREFPAGDISSQKIPDTKRIKEDAKASDGFMHILDGAAEELPFN